MKIGRVITSEVAPNRDGEKPVLLLKVEISDPDDQQTVEYIQSAGDDYNPPPGVTVFISEVGEAWKIAIGADDGIEPESAAGEREIYAHLDGEKKGRVKCKTDGIVEAGSEDLDFVAQSGKVDQIIADIMDVFTNWLPVSMDGGAALKTAWGLKFPTPPDSVASVNLKSEDGSDE